MQTENFFSVYGSGYTEQRLAAQRAFFSAAPKKARIAAIGMSLSIGLLGILAGTAQHVMSSAQAGAEFAARQPAK